MLKQRINFLLLIIIVTFQILYADDPCPYLSDPDNAILECTAAIKYGNKDNERLAIAYTNRAEAWNEKGEFDKSLNDSNKALSYQLNYLDAYLARGLASQGKKNYNNAITDYNEALQLIASGKVFIGGNAEYIAYMRRASVWGIKGNIDKSIVDSDTAIKQNPKGARAYYNLGLAWKLKGDYDKAVSYYNKAIELNPADPRALKTFKNEWENLNKKEQAALLYEDISFSGIVTTSPKVSHIYDSKETRYGKVLLVSERKNILGMSIYYNGEIIFSLANEYIALNDKQSIDEKEVILFSINCGGSACDPDKLNFLVIEKNGSSKIVSSKEFYSADGTILMKNEDGKIKVDLGFENGMKKSAIFDSEQINVTLDFIKERSLDIEKCEWLYKYPADECVDFKKYDLDCERFGRNFSGSSMATITGISAIKNHPGFISSALGSACVEMCNTGKKISFEQFKIKVCSIK